jgi:hypothetical protein
LLSDLSAKELTINSDRVRARKTNPFAFRYHTKERCHFATYHVNPMTVVHTRLDVVKKVKKNISTC